MYYWKYENTKICDGVCLFDNGLLSDEACINHSECLYQFFFYLGNGKYKGLFINEYISLLNALNVWKLTELKKLSPKSLPRAYGIGTIRRDLIEYLKRDRQDFDSRSSSTK